MTCKLQECEENKIAKNTTYKHNSRDQNENIN